MPSNKVEIAVDTALRERIAALEDALQEIVDVARSRLMAAELHPTRETERRFFERKLDRIAARGARVLGEGE